MKKYEALKTAGFLSFMVIEPGDMTNAMLAGSMRTAEVSSQSSLAYRVFWLIRSVELLVEWDTRIPGYEDPGRYKLTSSGFGVSPDVFEVEELHHTEWQKSVDRFIHERDLILQSGIKAPARLVFLEIRLAEFRAAMRKVAIAV